MTADRHPGRHTRIVARETAGLTVGAMAAQIGVAPTTLHDWEAGRYWPLDAMVRRWDAALMVALDRVIAGAHQPDTVPT